MGHLETKAVFWEFFKEKRQALGLTLREFCFKHKLDSGNTSRLERGLLLPPQDRDRLEDYAHYLGLKSGSDDWYTFFDLAAVSKGRIPSELMEDEKVVAKLPLIFRALREWHSTNRNLDALVNKVRGS